MVWQIDRLEFEKKVQVHHRKTLRIGVQYELRDSIKNEIDNDVLYHDKCMPSIADPRFG